MTPLFVLAHIGERRRASMREDRERERERERGEGEENEESSLKKK